MIPNQEATWKSSLRSKSPHVEGEVIVIDEAVLTSDERYSHPVLSSRRLTG